MHQGRHGVCQSRLLGAVSFPLGVWLQTLTHGLLPRAIAVMGSALLIPALTGFAAGFVRRVEM